MFLKIDYTYALQIMETKKITYDLPQGGNIYKSFFGPAQKA